MGFSLFWLFGCNKKMDELRPHNVIFEAAQFDTPDGYRQAVTGVYSLIATGNETGSGNFTDMQIFLSEAKGNTIRCLDGQVNRWTDAFNFINSSNKDMSNSYYFWRNSYNVLLHVNKILDHVKDDETDELILQAKAESLFLRAYIYFNLIRLYGKPYYQDAEKSPGVILVLTADLPMEFSPRRASVKQVYEQILTDLETSIPLFTRQKSASFAGRHTAEALLSRVYLYKGGSFNSPDMSANKLAFEYADRVIRNGGYSLLQGDDFIRYYDQQHIENKEDIFAINGEFANGSIASLWMMPEQTNFTGGLYRPSPYFLSLLKEEDKRRFFYIDNITPGFPDDKLAVNKYSIGYTQFYTRSPFRVLRLAEMYLNRAEALVKLGRYNEALTDVNRIRTRAGLKALNETNGETLFLEILNQRKIELAFEGHSSYDEYRNDLPMIRNYESARSGKIELKPADPRILLKIPDEEIASNTNLLQN